MKNTKNGKFVSKLQQALDILRGKTVIAHDRRAADAIAIEFRTYYYVKGAKRFRVVAPVYGVSNRLVKTLSSLAVKTEFVGGMPQFHFAAKVR